MQIADRATIMRDGKTITTVNVSDITIDDLIRGMVGHDLKEQFPKRDCPIGEVGFRVEGISREGILNNISFEARKGRGRRVCGLVGAAGRRRRGPSSASTRRMRAVCSLTAKRP